MATVLKLSIQIDEIRIQRKDHDVFIVQYAKDGDVCIELDPMLCRKGDAIILPVESGKVEMKAM